VHPHIIGGRTPKGSKQSTRKEAHRVLKSDEKEIEESCMNAEEQLYGAGIVD